MHRTYQLRGYTTKQGYARVDEVLRQCAQLYNAALEEWRNAYPKAWITVEANRGRGWVWDGSAWRRASPEESGLWFNRVNDHSRLSGLEPKVNYMSQCKHLTAIRKQDDRWARGTLSIQIGRGVLRRLERAVQGFYRRAKAGKKPGYPRFKSRRRWRSILISEPSPSMVKNRTVHIMGLPRIKIPGEQELPSTTCLKGLSLVRQGRRLIVNLTYEIEQPVGSASVQVPQKSAPHTASEVTRNAVGLDFGITNRITLSTGEYIGRRPIDRSAVEEAQRRRSRCTKGSREWRRRTSVIANLHYRERIRNRNECHRITTGLVRRFDLVVIENLSIRNMMGSAAGTWTNPASTSGPRRGSTGA